jgi:hypothetical protein
MLTSKSNEEWYGMNERYKDEESNHEYNEASVPTITDQEDVSAIDMVSDAVDEVIFGTDDE